MVELRAPLLEVCDALVYRHVAMKSRFIRILAPITDFLRGWDHQIASKSGRSLFDQERLYWMCTTWMCVLYGMRPPLFWVFYVCLYTSASHTSKIKGDASHRGDVCLYTSASHTPKIEGDASNRGDVWDALVYSQSSESRAPLLQGRDALVYRHVAIE